MSKIAAKEYTKGDVLNVFGRAVGRTIESAGSLFFLLSRLLSNGARGFFWLAGKHVDMIDTLKKIKNPGSGNGGGIIDVEGSPSSLDLSVSGSPSPKAEGSPIGKAGLLSHQDNRRITGEFEPIALALMYSQAAYEQQTLPLEEIMKIDRQAQVMAKALGNVLPASLLKSHAAKAADAYLDACSFQLRYHQTGNEKFKKKAARYLAEANDQKQALRKLGAGAE